MCLIQVLLLTFYRDEKNLTVFPVKVTPKELKALTDVSQVGSVPCVWAGISLIRTKTYLLQGLSSLGNWAFFYHNFWIRHLAFVVLEWLYYRNMSDVFIVRQFMFITIHTYFDLNGEMTPWLLHDRISYLIYYVRSILHMR